MLFTHHPAIHSEPNILRCDEPCFVAHFIFYLKANSGRFHRISSPTRQAEAITSNDLQNEYNYRRTGDRQDHRHGC